MGLKKFHLHIPAEHLNGKEREDTQRRRNTTISVRRERLHYKNEDKDTLRDEEWEEHDMRAEHAKMRIGFYDKFKIFLVLRRAIKKPYMRDYTYESLQMNKVETGVSVMYTNGGELALIYTSISCQCSEKDDHGPQSEGCWAGVASCSETMV
jgi:hypothetical protein